MVLDFGLDFSTDLFVASSVSGEGMGADSSTVIWTDVGIGIVPIGAVIDWHKDLAGVPALLPSFVQCDGQVLDDFESPLHGQTIPNLNGLGHFTRGGAVSGTTGGTTTHNHTTTMSKRATINAGGGCYGYLQSAFSTLWTAHIPVNTSMVKIMRVK